MNNGLARVLPRFVPRNVSGPALSVRGRRARFRLFFGTVSLISGSTLIIIALIK